jgi:hypothetical protein
MCELLVWIHLPDRRNSDVSAKLNTSEQSAMHLVFNKTERKITSAVLSEIIFFNSSYNLSQKMHIILLELTEYYENR